MTDPNSGQKRLVIVGATGMVGGYAFRYALEHYAVTSVTAIVRRKLGIPHPKLSEVFQDFADCSALAQAVSGQDAAVFCLGAYTGAVSAAELRTITVGYTIEFARAFGGVAESLADFAHRFIEPVVEIHEGVRRPEFFLKFFASYGLAGFSTSMTRTWKGGS